jgi:hypothetical protein
MVSWTWPVGVRLAMVSFRAEDTETIPQEITLGDYKRRGGVEYKAADKAEVTVAGALRAGRELLLGAPATTTVAPQPVIATYVVSRLWWDWFGLSRRRELTVKTSRPCRDVGVEVFLHSPKSGAERDVRLDFVHALEVGPGLPCRVTVTLRDRGIRRPYYISVRVDSSSAELIVDFTKCIGREVS